MKEYTKYEFKRSEIQKGLEDVVLEVELSESEIKIIEKIRGLERNKYVFEAVFMGSTRVREYKTNYPVMYGYCLVGSREEIMSQLTKSRDFISNNLSIIEKETPKCAGIFLEIRDSLNEILE